jgi:hypothetical protein
MLGLETKTDRLTDRQSQCDFDFEFSELSWVLCRRQFRAIERPVQLWLLHGLRKDYKGSEDNRIQRRIQEQSSRDYKRRLELECVKTIADRLKKLVWNDFKVCKPVTVL